MNIYISVLIVFISCNIGLLRSDLVVYKDGKGNKEIVKRDLTSSLPKVKEFIVNTRVKNHFAETTVLSVVENGDNHPKQTTFSVVLPKRAFVSDFFMEINGTIYKSFVKEREEAKKIYKQFVAGGNSAGYVAVSTRFSNRFTINVNVEPVSKVNFHLSYEELLEREKGQYEIIANIQPGQIVKKIKVEVEIQESKPLLFVRVPSLRTGNILYLQNDANLDPQAKITIANTSASVKFYPDISRQLQFACAGLGNKEYNGFAGQFVVQYDVERDAGGETLAQDGFFVNYFSPPNLEHIPKHIVFVLDTSGSMDGMKIIQMKEAMKNILPQLYSDDLFSIVEYSGDVSVYDFQSKSTFIASPLATVYGNWAAQLQKMALPDAIAATTQNVKTAITTITKLLANGATNSIAALEVGLYLVQRVQEAQKGKYTPILVFLTDGFPNGGIDNTSKIISLVTGINSKQYKTPIYSLSVGDDANWDFLRELSLANEGEPMLIKVVSGTDSDLRLQLQNFYDKISTPVLSNINFNLPPSAQPTKAHYPVFFNGSEITIVGKDNSIGGIKPLTLSAKSRDGLIQLEAKIGVPLARLERVWAYVTVNTLLDEFYATSSQDKKQALSKAVLNIAMEYSLVTDFTSLIVVKPNDTNTALDAEDASVGVFAQTADELPMCNNITEWIITNYGTPEPTTPEATTEVTTEIMTTTEITTTAIPTTTTTQPTTRTTKSTTLITKPTTIKPTTTKPTTTKPTTTKPTATTVKRTTTEKVGDGPIESEFGITLTASTTERIKTCNDSAFGCCFDGVSEAAGLNYSGCDPIPKSESCSLPEDVGSCQDYTQKWAYNIKEEKCRQFWYGGCGGTDNRFATKDDCNSVCIDAKQKDRCHLPRAFGSCNRGEVSWYYDKQKDECYKFLYGGCLGNSNRFKSKMDCVNECQSSTKHITVQDACIQPLDHGTCRKFEKQYFYNITRGVCRQFWYGGCGGNENRFEKIEQCNKACIEPDGRDICNLPPVKGECKDYKWKWYFDKSTKSCTQFTYGGCHGNKNRFDTEMECSQTCGAPSHSPDNCYLKKDGGSNCAVISKKWYFNNKLGLCKPFYYKGCGGNENRFNNDKECDMVCRNPLGKDRCKLPKISGPCKETHIRWYYDKHKKTCRNFIYHGCNGNNNNFNSLQECKQYCK